VAAVTAAGIGVHFAASLATGRLGKNLLLDTAETAESPAVPANPTKEILPRFDGKRGFFRRLNLLRFLRRFHRRKIR